MGTDSFIVYLKAKDIYSDIAKDVETRFVTSNYELDRPLPKRRNKKVIRLMNDELRGKIMTYSSTLRAKPYSYLTDNSNEEKNAKSTKK